MDPDGAHIKNLLFVCLWYLCPELIFNGHVYVGVPPLFRITTKKNEYIYLKGQKELEEYKEAHKGQKFLINRNKGLGEQDSSELEECLLKPDSRVIEQITIEDQKKAEDLLEIFMGPEIEPRREYIILYSEKARD